MCACVRVCVWLYVQERRSKGGGAGGSTYGLLLLISSYCDASRLTRVGCGVSEACLERLNDVEGWTSGSDASLLPVPVGAYDGGFEDGYSAKEVSSVISFT